MGQSKSNVKEEEEEEDEQGQRTSDDWLAPGGVVDG